jgi:thiol-disulfide isomerase/thioredoxin
MSIKVASDKHFSELLSENDSVLAFFRTDWCPLCNDVDEILRLLEAKYDLLSVLIIDFDKNEALIDKYEIVGIPTVATFKCGEMTGCFPGLREDFSYDEMAYSVCTDTA